jgi:hypothetical protein
MSHADPDGHWWEEFKNAWRYQHWVDDKHLNAALEQDAKNDLSDLNRRGALENGKSAADRLRGKSNKEIVDAYQDINSKLELQKVLRDATWSPAAALLGTSVYRGGASMEARPGVDIRIDPNTGLVKPGYGISLNSDPDSLAQFGGAYEIDQSTVPPELEIKQIGSRPGHYELTAREPMTPGRYNELASQVKFK